MTMQTSPIIRCDYHREIPTVPADFNAPAEFLKALEMNASTGTAQLLVGPAGTGKTQSAAIVAHRLGRPFLKFDASAVTFASDWFGFPTTVDGRIGWQDSTLVSALADPNAVILIDEINRADSRALNGLLGLLDRNCSGYVQFPQRSEPIRFAPGCAVFASANVGLEFVGTGQLDAALEDRFQVFELDYLPRDEERALLMSRTGCAAEVAEAIAFLAAHTRTSAWIDSGGRTYSTRAAIEAARLASVYQAQGFPASIAIRALLTKQPRASTNGSGKSPRERLAAVFTAQHPLLA
jgi:MoxR-like ATPase